MAQVGTFVQASEIPPAPSTAFDPSTAFVVGFADWGPADTAVPVSSVANMAATIGSPQGTANPYNARTATCSTAFDALETFFGEGGYRAYFSRVCGPNPVKASIALAPAAALTITALYTGQGGNAIYVAVQNNTTNYVLTFQDVNGNIVAQSPLLLTLDAGVAWVLATGLATAVKSGSTLPSTAVATAMAGGDDKHASATLADWQAALAGCYSLLGPGQVFAPGQTNGSLNGIWSALQTHASTFNRVALLDMDDNTAAATLIAAVSSIQSSANASYCGFWAGNVQIPGVTASTTRSVSPSAAIAGLCARVDPQQQGNVNQPAAGINYPLQFAIQNQSTVSGSGGAIYSAADLYALNDAGINTFSVHSGLFLNYGFVSAALPTSDVIFWMFNHARTRMALVADAQIVGEPFVFSQIDGQASDQLALQGALAQMLTGYYNRGALFGITAADAFSVDTGASVNTPQSMQSGRLNGVAQVRLSPFAQKVTINLNAVPITQTV